MLVTNFMSAFALKNNMMKLKKLYIYIPAIGAGFALFGEDGLAFECGEVDCVFCDWIRRIDRSLLNKE